MPEPDTAPKLDDETTAALTLFNEYVNADRERTQREKRVKKAERTKDDAAALVKKLGERGSAEEKAEAEQAYRDAADRWKKLRNGEDPDAAPTEPEAAEPEPATPTAEAEPAADTPTTAEPETVAEPEAPTADEPEETPATE